MQVLNKYDKEKLVIKLHQEGKTIRQIASEARLSFGTIGKIIRRFNGVENNETISNDMKNKSKATQALNLFLRDKRPVEVAIELDLSASEVEGMLQEYWVLNQLDELALVYLEIKSHLDLFMRLFHIMKKNRLINEKNIKTVLKYAAGLPSLENKFRGLANTILDLEIKKRELSAQLVDLGCAIDQYQCAIGNEKERLMKMNASTSEKAIHRGGELKLAKT
jgi:transposase